MAGEIQVCNASHRLEWRGKIKIPVGEYTYVGQNIHSIPVGWLEGRTAALAWKDAPSAAGGRLEMDSQNKQNL